MKLRVRAIYSLLCNAKHVFSNRKRVSFIVRRERHHIKMKCGFVLCMDNCVLKHGIKYPLFFQATGEGRRHPLQPDPSLLNVPGRRVRRRRRHPHLSLRGPHPRLAPRQQQRQEGLRAAGGPRRRLRHQDLQLLQEVRLRHRCHGSQLQEHWRGDNENI